MLGASQPRADHQPQDSFESKGRTDSEVEIKKDLSRREVGMNRKHLSIITVCRWLAGMSVRPKWQPAGAAGMLQTGAWEDKIPQVHDQFGHLD